MATGTQIDVVMPQMGVSVSEGTITKWLKPEGEPIAARRAAARDLDRQGRHRGAEPGEGVVAQILVQEGETVDVGTVLAVIAPAGADVSAPAPAGGAGAGARHRRQPRMRPRLRRPRRPSPRRPLRLRAPAAAAPLPPRPAAPTTAGRSSRRSSPASPPSTASTRRGAGHRHRRPRDEEGHPRLHRVRRPGCRGASARPTPLRPHRRHPSRLRRAPRLQLRPLPHRAHARRAARRAAPAPAAAPPPAAAAARSRAGRSRRACAGRERSSR